MDIEGISNFIKAVRTHFPTGRKTDDEERAWVKSLGYVLRDYVGSELAYAAETIITTRETRGFPLPAECLKACAHARHVLQRRKLLTVVAQPPPKEPVPGIEIWRKRDEEWRKEQLAKRESRNG